MQNRRTKLCGGGRMIIEKRDINFLFSWLDLDVLLRRPRHGAHDAADIDAIIDLVTRIAEAELATCLRASDTHEPHLDGDGRVRVLPEIAKAVRQIAEAGVFAMVFDAE